MPDRQPSARIGVERVLRLSMCPTLSRTSRPHPSRSRDRQAQVLLPLGRDHSSPRTRTCSSSVRWMRLTLFSWVDSSSRNAKMCHTRLLTLSPKRSIIFGSMSRESVQMPQPTDRFNRQTVRVDGRLLIKTFCAQCGESKIASAADGSLAVWEEQHECKRVTVFPGSPQRWGHA